uniref:Uncharacterized protein n=1 Tax=Ciona savignyi TaxID=51511 RepID=H2Y9Z8_CIOSA
MNLAVLVLTLMVVGFGSSMNLEQCSIKCDSANAPAAGTPDKKLEVSLQISEHIHSKALAHYDVRFDRDFVFSPSTNKISKIYDQGLSQTHITQSDAALQPVLSPARQNGHRFMHFDGNGNKRLLGNINLNPASGQLDLLTVFIVFRVDGFDANTHWVRNGIFGHDDYGYDKFICFLPDGTLMVSGATNNNVQVTEFPNKANPGAIGQWNVLSVQWNVEGGAAASSVYCNGKLLAKFQSRTSPGDVRFSVGDLDPRGLVPLKGAIGDFVMYRDCAI